MKIKEVMTKYIYTGNVEDSIYDLAKKMKNKNVGFLPIVEDNRIIGVLTDRDIVVKILANEDRKNIRGYLHTEIIFVEEDASIEEALQKMKQFKVKRILVVKDKKVTGILSLSDLFMTESDSLLETIHSIFKNEQNIRMESAEIDSFYL